MSESDWIIVLIWAVILTFGYTRWRGETERLRTQLYTTQRRVAETIEECAAICDGEASVEGIAQRCAAKIRALKEEK